MNTEALAGQHVTVFGFLHQEANLCQQAVQEAGQHGGASDHHQVLREHFTGVDGALKQTQTDILGEKNKKKQTKKNQQRWKTSVLHYPTAATGKKRQEVGVIPALQKDSGKMG